MRDVLEHSIEHAHFGAQELYTEMVQGRLTLMLSHMELVMVVVTRGNLGLVSCTRPLPPQLAPNVLPRW